MGDGNGSPPHDPSLTTHGSPHYLLISTGLCYGLIPRHPEPTVMPAIIATSSPARSLTAAAIPTVEVDVTLSMAPSAGPPCPAARARASTRLASSATVTRSAISARACRRRWRTSRIRSPPRSSALGATEQTSSTPLIELDGTPNKRARRQRDPRRVDGDRACRAQEPGCRCIAISADRRQAARPDDEHPQRRRARGQHRRPAGIHDHAARRRVVPATRFAWASRSSTR